MAQATTVALNADPHPVAAACLTHWEMDNVQQGICQDVLLLLMMMLMMLMMMVYNA